MNAKTQRTKPVNHGALSNRFTGGKAPILIDDSAKGQFVVMINNAEATAKSFAIFSGLLNTVAEILAYAGKSVDYIATDGVNVNGSSVTLNTVTSDGLALLRRWLNANPTAVVSMQVQASSTAQLSNPIVSKRVHPLQKFGEDRIIPQAFQTAKDANNTLVNIELADTILGDESLFIVNVNAGSWLNITFSFGDSRDDFALMVENEKNA